MPKLRARAERRERRRTRASPSAVRLLVTDLDNTLYDWVTYYASAFRALTTELSKLLDVEEATLLDEFRRVHVRYKNSEQPFAALELPSVRRRYGNLPAGKLKERLDSAFHAFNSARKRHLRLYESVQSTLTALRQRGIVVAALTDAIAENAYFRLRRLGVVHHFLRIYARQGDLTPHPDPSRQAELRAPPDLVRGLPSFCFVSTQTWPHCEVLSPQEV